ncbi:amidohydrolase [Alkalibaculum sp. M08DMB]|uniref:Amidohydrolase n=1 Tax=Alkalibaculum sporogenes TaxID=2655001 RepID=A0A6A7K6B8_9FIRM|nr:M20 family metallopeptidase [Alkalibaculum sporogenes]MPW24703.1 amidohydrolase [Alkalibaculum sporogenes]
MIVRKGIMALNEEAVSIRRKLHTIPEEGFEEFKTSDYIYKYLIDLGIENIERVATTGIVAFIPGQCDETIAFRADMDGLSVDEDNICEYKSIHKGMMHACGHDGHMTIMLLLAKYIVENKIVSKYNVLLIFQPAEEGPGGAKVIIEQGLLQKYAVRKIYGCHIMPTIDEGKIGCKPGPLMAQTGEFYITVRGTSAHAASPHKSVDAIMISANLINALNTIVSRNMDPIETTLFSIGTINGGTRVNVVAGEVKLSGTMRAFDEKTYYGMRKRLLDISKGVESAFNCTIDCNVIEMYPPVVNDQRLYQEFVEIVNDFDYEEVLPMMIAEDFSYYQREVPGLFFYLGSKNNQKDFIYDLHHSKFNFNEIILLNAVEIYAKIIEQ